MKYVIGLIVAVAIYLVLAKFLGHQPQPKPVYASTDEMMVHFAKVAEQWMKKDKGVDLDYSLASIKTVQDHLGALAKELANEKSKEKKDEETFNWALAYGAYLGEIIRRREGGSWATDHPEGGPRTYPLMTTNHSLYFPVVWSWKLLTGGASESFIQEELRKAQTNRTGTVSIPTNMPSIPKEATGQKPPGG